jgi:hypothetical protein
MLSRVTRSKISALLVFALLLSTLMPVMAFGASVQLKDVADSYAQKEIQALVDAGVISGYEDGSFQPRKAMTRAELAKIIVLSLGLKENPDKAAPFKDVDATSWYRGYVGALVEAGITQGTSSTTFSPNANVTREELVVFFLRGFGLDEAAAKLKADAELSDLNQVSDWAKGHVSLAFKIGFVNGIGNGDGSLKFAPKENAERQALARLAYEFKTNKSKFIDKAKEIGKTAGVAVEVLEITAVTAVSNTSVEVTFNQELTAVSKDDFKFDNNLTVTNAELKASNKKVVVLTTGSQALNTTYKLSYKGKDTGKSIVGNPGGTGGGGGGAAATTPAQTDAQKINSGGSVSGPLTVASSDTFGPQSGTTTVNGNLFVGTGTDINATLRNVVVNGTLTLNPGSAGVVSLQNVNADNIEVLSGAPTSIKLLQTVVKQLRVNAVNNGGKTVRIAAQEGTTVDSVEVSSDVIVESESSTGKLSKITLTSAASGKSISLRGNITGEITSEAADAEIKLDPPTNGNGATALSKLTLNKNAKIIAGNGTTLSSVYVGAPNTSVSFQGQGTVSNVVVDANAGDSSLEFSADSNVQGVEAAASFKVKGDADKIVNLNVKTSGNATVSVDNTVQPSQTAKDNAKQKAIDAIDAIGQLPNEYSKEVETKISFAQNKVRIAEQFGVPQNQITNYATLATALQWLASFQQPGNVAGYHVFGDVFLVNGATKENVTLIVTNKATSATVATVTYGQEGVSTSVGKAALIQTGSNKLQYSVDVPNGTYTIKLMHGSQYASKDVTTSSTTVVELPYGKYYSQQVGPIELSAATKGSVTGVVYVAGTTNVISGATVTVTGTTYTATTDTDGKYTLSNLPAGDHTLEVSKNGYNSLTGQVVAVSAGQTVTRNFELVEAAAATGTVTGYVYGRHGVGLQNGVQVKLGSATATADLHGKFVFANVTPGLHELSVSNLVSIGFADYSALVNVTVGANVYNIQLTAVTQAVYFNYGATASVVNSVYGNPASAGNNATAPYKIPAGLEYIIVTFSEDVAVPAGATVSFKTVTGEVYSQGTAVQDAVYVSVRSNLALQQGHTYGVELAGLKFASDNVPISTVTFWVYQE